MTTLIIGVLLLLWVVYDLFAGSVWSYRKIYRESEPGAYWFTMAVWFLVACFAIVPYLYWYM